ncbi:MAG: hypothetical protein OXG38_08640 [Chloroflexi bacterium]|nr:hypothetical protein [Chloroflexota bacterium]
MGFGPPIPRTRACGVRGRGGARRRARARRRPRIGLEAFEGAAAHDAGHGPGGGPGGAQRQPGAPSDGGDADLHDDAAATLGGGLGAQSDDDADVGGDVCRTELIGGQVTRDGAGRPEPSGGAEDDLVAAALGRGLLREEDDAPLAAGEGVEGNGGAGRALALHPAVPIEQPWGRVPGPEQDAQGEVVEQVEPAGDGEDGGGLTGDRRRDGVAVVGAGQPLVNEGGWKGCGLGRRFGGGAGRLGLALGRLVLHSSHLPTDPRAGQERGMPSPRPAMMLRWISLVPPSIVLATVRM